MIPSNKIIQHCENNYRDSNISGIDLITLVEQNYEPHIRRVFVMYQIAELADLKSIHINNTKAV